MFGFPLTQIFQSLTPLVTELIHGQLDQGSDVEQCNAKAESLFTSEMYVQAEECFKKIIQDHGEVFTNEKCCHFWIRLIDCQLRQKKIIEAISSCLRGIKKLPEMDDLYRKFVDIYLPHGDLFFQNLTQLQQYFGEQTCYVKFNRTDEDILKIVFDFFDYTTKRSVIIHDLFKDIVTKSGMRDELVDFLSYFLDSKVEVLASRIEGLSKEVDELNEILNSPVGSLQKVEDLALRVAAIKLQLLGGAGSEIPSGFCAYAKMYGDIAKKYEKHYNDSKFLPSHERFSAISESARKLISLLLAEGQKPGICQKLQHERAMIKETSSEEEEEVPALEWIRRGNLMNYLFARFQLPEDDATAALTRAEIDIDDLFSCDIMDHVAGEHLKKTDEQPGLRSFFEKNKLDTLKELKAYIDDAKLKR